MFDFILFDFDDTILDFKMSERVALEKTFKKSGLYIDDEIAAKYSAYNLSQWKRLELGEISREEVKVNRFRLLFDDIKVDASPEETTAVYEEYLSHGHFFIDDAEDMVIKLSKSHRLFIVSNGAKKVQQGRMHSAQLEPYFENVFISEDVGFEKPDVRFFDYCFSHIENFDKSSAMIVGDSLTSDILGGNNAGVKTVWFNPMKAENNSNAKPDYIITSLKELDNIV